MTAAVAAPVQAFAAPPADKGPNKPPSSTTSTTLLQLPRSCSAAADPTKPEARCRVDFDLAEPATVRLEADVADDFSGTLRLRLGNQLQASGYFADGQLVAGTASASVPVARAGRYSVEAYAMSVNAPAHPTVGIGQIYREVPLPCRSLGGYAPCYIAPWIPFPYVTSAPAEPVATVASGGFGVTVSEG